MNVLKVLCIVELIFFCTVSPARAGAVKKLDDNGMVSAFTAPAIGEIVYYKTKYEDTFVQIARSNDIGYVELLAANPGIDPWLPGANADLAIPTMYILPDASYEGIVINLPEMRLFYYPHLGAKPVSFPIGIGREGLETPLGQTTVRSKVVGPIWRPTARMRAEDPTLPEVVPAGPSNPLGTHAMYLGWPEYRIHGTDKPYGIGRRSSSGCIRMYPEDIIKLYPLVPVGTRVTVVNQPVKAAWVGSRMYIEAHPTMEQASQLELGNDSPITYELSDQDMRYIMRAAGSYAEQLDWPKIRQVIRERRGYPIPVAEMQEKTTERQ